MPAAPPAAGWRAGLLPLLRRPRVALAVKAALAACLAWVVAQQLPGVAAEYPYYAPMGAVIAMHPTLTSSLRESAQSIAGILLGGGIALAASDLLPAGPAVLALVIALAVLVGGLPWLGDQRSWVPIAALFVLVIGSGGERADYVVAYAGLTLLGAAIAVVVNWLLPSLPVNAASRSTDQLREALAEQLHTAADRVDPAAPSGARGEAGAGVSTQVQPLLSAMRAAVEEAAEAARANRLAGRYQAELDAEFRLARELERVAFLVQDLTSLVREDPWERSGRPLEITLRAPLAEALHAVAEVLTTVGPDGADPDCSTRAQRAVHHLSSELRRHDLRTSELLQVATATTGLQRCLAAVAPSGAVAPPLAEGA